MGILTSKDSIEILRKSVQEELYNRYYERIRKAYLKHVNDIVAWDSIPGVDLTFLSYTESGLFFNPIQHKEDESKYCKVICDHFPEDSLPGNFYTFLVSHGIFLHPENFDNHIERIDRPAWSAYVKMYDDPKSGLQFVEKINKYHIPRRGVGVKKYTYYTELYQREVFNPERTQLLNMGLEI